MSRTLSGVVEPGRGLGSAVMTGVYLSRLSELLGFDAVPGTLNVRLTEPVARDETWSFLASSEIAPGWEAATGQTGYHYLPVLVLGRHRAIAFQADEAQEPGYPADQVELICETHLRRELALADGDEISFTVVD
jgi:CTP-dependent riboflavin kinase